MTNVSTSPTRIHKRPFGVKAIVVLEIITFAALVIELLALKRSGETQLLRALQDGFEFPRIIFAASGIVIAFGLWRLRRWAWVALMIQLGLYLTLDLVAYFEGNPSYRTMLINVITVFYFNQFEVQAAFETEKGQRRRFFRGIKGNE